MAVLTGTSQTRFPPFDSPNMGVSALIAAGEDAVMSFLGQSHLFYENQYVEDGVQNVPGFSTVNKTYGQAKQPSKRRVLTQAPQGTVFLKKRLFSSLRSNFDPRFMSEKEKLFIRASKKLFARKAQELAFAESLSNIERLFDEQGFLQIDRITDSSLDSLLTVVERSFLGVFSGTVKSIEDIIADTPHLQAFSGTLTGLLKLRRINNRSKSNKFTTWIVDHESPDNNQLGAGVGVMELNQVASLSTNVGLDPGSGSAKLELQDPYRIMLISDLDIEVALRDAIADPAGVLQSADQLASDLLARADVLDVRLNAARRERGASEVNFQFILGADAPVGTLIATGTEFTTNSIFNIIGRDAFIGTEGAVVAEIFAILNAWHATQNRTLNMFQIVNEKYNDVRQRLRNEFMGHSIIQQMDQVSVFLNSNTRDVSPGFQTPNNFVELMQQGLADQQGALDISTIKLEHEELGIDVPFLLYAALRKRDVFRQDGVQVYSGLVTGVESEYTASSGVFKLSVSCADNTKFLEMSQWALTPSQLQPRAMLHDPLTPFDLEIDKGTGLVASAPQLSDENKKRLRYLRFDDGQDAGEHVDEKNIYQDRLVGGRVQTYQHVPGLVYKWKSGIIVETLNVNTKKPLSGEGPTVADVIDTFGVTQYQNPFGGLDAADVMSILITGQPHNYATFLQHAVSSGTFSIDNSGQNKAYFNYLFDFLERQDLVQGNFVPAVSSPIDPSVAARVFKEKRKLEGLNTNLNTLLRRKAELEDKIRSSKLASSDAGSRSEGISASILELKKEIAKVMSRDHVDPDAPNDNIQKTSLGVSGNDVYVNFEKREDLDNLKRQMRYKLKKKSEDVRYNQDINHFIVSELYDSDTDIQAIAQNLKKGSPDLFKSDYESPLDKCKQAAKSIGFEFFANSQGNLVFRPPEYNKTPLSLLLKILALSKTEGVNYAPDFLQSLFTTRSDQLLEEIQLLELEILERLILLGQPVSKNNQVKVASQVAGSGVGIIPGSEVVLSLEAHTLDENGNQEWTVSVEQLKKEVEKERLFSIEQQQALQAQGELVQGDSPPGSNTVMLIEVRNAIKRMLGRDYKTQKISDNEALSEVEKELQKYQTSADFGASVNRLKAVNEIAQRISARQRLSKMYFAAEKNLNEFKVGSDPKVKTDLAVPSSVAAQLRGMGIDPVFPKFMEHLIENDLSNEDGFRSGKRFIINDDVILSMNLTVKTPEFNMIQVTGNQDLQNTDTETGALGPIPYVFWAGAVDYDSWRKFGLKVGQTIHRADFVDAQTQSAPYALFKLQEQRKEINKGNITVIGNEFYQAGDVVYVTSRSMLYYVTSVNHSYDFNNANFQTTLELGYGRALGEYIPTPLDIIGKGMLSVTRKHIGRMKANRTAVSHNHAVHLGTLYHREYNGLTSSSEEKARETFKKNKANQDAIRRIIQKSETRINNKLGVNRVEVRTYYMTTENAETNAKLIERAIWLGDWVTEMLTEPLPKSPESSGTIDIHASVLDSSNVVQIKPIDMSPDFEPENADEERRIRELRRFPSAQAWAGENPFVAQDGVGLPLNAIDVYFTSEKTQYGNVPPITLDNRDVI